MEITRRTKTIALSGLLTALALTVSGCSMLPNQAGTEVAEAAPSYGDVVGSGEMVTTPSGTYEKIILSENSPAYEYAAELHDRSSGWTVEEAIAGQKLAVDYVTQEFLDSTALEGGDAEFRRWHDVAGKKYFSESVIGETSRNPGETKIILGNFGANNFIPALIHDGSPRVKDVQLDPPAAVYKPWETGAGLAQDMQYSIQFDAGYRVDDVNGAAFVGKQVGMTGDKVLTSKYATDRLKDGTGENVYRAKGYANVVVTKAPGGMKIVGFESKADFDTRDFANQDAK